MTNKTEKSETPKVAVKKIVVQVGSREIILSIEDATALREALNGLFGTGAVTEVREVVKESHHYHNNWYWNNQPYWYGSGTWKYEHNPGVVFCSAGAASSGGISSSSANIAGAFTDTNGHIINLEVK